MLSCLFIQLMLMKFDKMSWADIVIATKYTCVL